MINLFLPRSIDNYFFSSFNILHIYLIEKNIYCFLVKVSGNKRVIKNFVSIPFDFNTIDNSIEDFFSQTISTKINDWKYTKIKITISSNNSFFKIAYFPFSSIEKIKMIMPFEVEGDLPFSLSDCTVDSLTTIEKKNKTGKYPALGVAVKNDIISILKEIIINKDDSNELFFNVDFTEIISFHALSNISEPHIIVFTNDESIVIILFLDSLYFCDFKIVNLKNYSQNKFNKNVFNQYQSLEEDKKKELNEKEEDTFEKKKSISSSNNHNQISGINHEKSVNDIREYFEKNKTVENENHATPKENTFEENEKTIFLEVGKIIKIIVEKNNILDKNLLLLFLGKKNEFINNNNFKNIFPEYSLWEYKKYLTEKNKISLKTEEDFSHKEDKKNYDESPLNDFFYFLSTNNKFSMIVNLNSDNTIKIKNNLLFKQIIMSIALSLIIVIFNITINLIKINNLKKSIKKGESEAILFLKKEFNLMSKHTGTLDNALKEVKKNIEEIENTLPYIATNEKDVFIKIFSIISKNLSHDIKNMQINTIIWKNGLKARSDLFIINGSVGDFNSLHLFEEGLRLSNIFSTIPHAQDLHFSFSLILNSYDIINKQFLSEGIY